MDKTGLLRLRNSLCSSYNAGEMLDPNLLRAYSPSPSLLAYRYLYLQSSAFSQVNGSRS
jgi:hypothetical protein